MSIHTLSEYLILQIFQNSLSTVLIRRLIPLQERTACQGAKDDLGVSRVMIQQGRRRRASNQASTAELRALLRPLKPQSSRSQRSFITYKKLGNGEFIECKNSDLEFPNDTDIQEELFTKVSCCSNSIDYVNFNFFPSDCSIILVIIFK